MSSLYLFALFLTLCLAEYSGNNESWDFLQLVVQWPGSSCKTRDCIPSIKKVSWWSLHGLWPQRNDGSWPQFCHGAPSFDEDSISPVLPLMNKFWPTYYEGAATKFWEHEYSKKQLDFFFNL